MWQGDGRKPDSERPPIPEPGDRLRDMQWVIANVGRKTEPPGHRALRQWLSKDPKGFMKALAELEEERKAAAEPKVENGNPQAPLAADVGTEQAIALVEKMIGDYKAGRRS